MTTKMPDPAPVTDALGKLRARCEAAGLSLFPVNDDSNIDYDFMFSDYDGFTLYFDYDPAYTFKGADAGIQAAHWLLDGYERRDCECEDGYKQYGISPYGRVYIKCPNCQGRVPPGVGDEH